MHKFLLFVFIFSISSPIMAQMGNSGYSSSNYGTRNYNSGLNSFKYGAPPHGGIAIGFDRLVAVLNGNESIRDFIAFPKNNQGKDIMLNSPSTVSDKQLKELNLKFNKPNNKVNKN